MTKPTVTSIVINFGAPVHLPEGFEHVLDALANLVCKQYERDNPTRVMWPAESGFMPTRNFYSGGDGPLFDESTVIIGCSEREDWHGRNPHNPDREALQQAARAEARANRPAKEDQPWM